MQCCGISEKRLVSGAVIARQGEPRAVLAVLTSFMIETREGRRGEVPSSEGETKNQRKRKDTLVKRNVTVQHVQHQKVQQDVKKKKKKKKKEKKRKTEQQLLEKQVNKQQKVV